MLSEPFNLKDQQLASSESEGENSVGAACASQLEGREAQGQQHRMGKSCSLQHITRVVGYEAKFIVALRAACWDHIPTDDADTKRRDNEPGTMQEDPDL